jgi:hypothetical protein
LALSRHSKKLRTKDASWTNDKGRKQNERKTEAVNRNGKHQAEA